MRKGPKCGNVLNCALKHASAKVSVDVHSLLIKPGPNLAPFTVSFTIVAATHRVAVDPAYIYERVRNAGSSFGEEQALTEGLCGGQWALFFNWVGSRVGASMCNWTDT